MIKLKLMAVISVFRDIRFVIFLLMKYFFDLWRYRSRSKSQLRQDLFALNALGFKRNGYFVEFGAADGKVLSNTWLLEKDFGWSGILAEPARGWRDSLELNRSCVLCFDCVWNVSNYDMSFHETDIGELSTLTDFQKADCHGDRRQGGKTYTVRTISLNDLLSKYKAPEIIDYLSIDTEGSEYEILSAFDFSKYSFNVITCEHNYSHNRILIYKLLIDNGYKRVFSSLSRFDDWYVHERILGENN